MGRQQIPLRFLAPVMVLQESNPTLYDELLQQFNLGDLTDAYSQTIDIGLYRRIISWFYERTNNRSLGFSVGLTSSMNATGPIGVYLSGCSNLSIALNELKTYYPIVRVDDSQLEIKAHEKGIMVELSDFEFSTIVDVYTKDVMLGRIIRLCNRVAGPEYFPELIGYPESDFKLPENLDQFANKIMPTKDKMILFFTSQVLSKSALYANTEIQKLLKPKLDEELEQLNRVDSLLVQIQDYLGGLDSLKDVTQASVASNFNMSLSSLRRRLSETESSFSDFFQRYRRNKSLDLLSQPEIKLDVVAEMLGFSERASFDRAFRQWFSTTPAKFREQIGVLSVDSLDSLDVNQLPTSPKSCSQILNLLNSKNFSIGDLVELVALDPLLSAKIMAISRSAFYGARNVKDLHDAISKVIGVEQVRYLALITATNDSFAKNLPANFCLENYWRTALLTAHFISAFQPHSKIEMRFSQNEMYLIGLFFNIGVFMLANMYPGETERFLNTYPNLKSSAEVRELEVEVFGTTIYSAGALLIAHWDLPKSVFTTVKELDSPDDCAKLSVESQLIKATASFVFRFYPNMDNDDLKGEFIQAIHGVLKIPNETIEKIIERQNLKFPELQLMIKELIA